MSVSIFDIIDGPHYAASVVQEHLEFYTRQLVLEARADRYDYRTRSSFLVAVGAEALRTTLLNPQFRIIAHKAIEAESGLLAIEAHDTSMPYWNDMEWKQQVTSVFTNAQFKPGTAMPADDTWVGYDELLEALRSGNASFN